MQTYRTPLQSIALSEANEIPKSVQLFRTGTFYHSEYGKFDITPEVLKELKKNFDDQVRGIDLAIDYKHENEDIAAGWIKNIRLSDDRQELWADVDWTKRGQSVLSEKEFRYLSPEFTFQYEDNETLKKFGPTLLGAGLTNRPTIKKMAPVVELSEYKINEENKKMGEDQIKCGDPMEMSPEDMAKLPSEQLLAMLQSLVAKHKEMMGSKEKIEVEMGEMKKEKALSEKKGVFAKMLSEGRACKAQEQAFLDGDMVKFAELAQPIKLDEVGTTTVTENKNPKFETKAEAEKEVSRLATLALSEKKFKTMGDAISGILKDQTELRSKIYG